MSDKTKTDTGGEAFAAYGDQCGQVGMTLLDYFAGQAINGIMQNQGVYEEWTHQQLAASAYAMAAAMVAEKRKREAMQ